MYTLLEFLVLLTLIVGLTAFVFLTYAAVLAVEAGGRLLVSTTRTLGTTLLRSLTTTPRFASSLLHSAQRFVHIH